MVRQNVVNRSIGASMKSSIAGVILAGGRSTRMGREKALMELAGEPVVGRVIGRLAPQVARVILNANGDAARFEAFGLPVIADRPTKGNDAPGPLAGVLAALTWAKPEGFTHIATTPADAPFLPDDLVARLAEGLAPDEVAMAQSETGLEPMFALWPVVALPILEKRFAAGERAPRRLIRDLKHRIVTFETDPAMPDPFFNLNRPDDIAAAEFWIKGW